MLDLVEIVLCRQRQHPIGHTGGKSAPSGIVV
jgi:hypothetical protein